MRQGIQRAQTFHREVIVKCTHVVTTNANTLGTKTPSCSLNALSLHLMPGPIQEAGKQGWTNDHITHCHARLCTCVTQRL